MMAFRNNAIGAVPLDKVAHRMKAIPKDHYLIDAARKTGIYFGDEKII